MHRILSQVLRESDFAVESLVRVSDPAYAGTLIHTEQAVGDSLVLFGTCTTPGVDNYCLVIFVDAITDTFLTHDIPSYFTAIRNYLGERFEPPMPKNFSLIVCWRRETTNTPEMMHPQLLQIEEDPFDFKKYVLVYNQSEVDCLHQEWQKSQLPLLSFLNTYLYQEGNFTLFKNRTAPVAYNLATRLFIKVPFLQVRVNERQYEDLETMIRSSLGTELTTLRDELLKLTLEELSDKLQETETDQK